MVTLTMIHEATEAVAPALAARIKAGARALWQALEVVGRVRAAVYLEHLAASYETSQPELARRLRDAAHYRGTY